MKKTALTIIIALLIFILGFQLGRITKRDTQPQVVQSQAAQPMDERDEFEDYEAYISARYEGLPLDLDAIKAIDHTGRQIPLRDLAAPGTVFARFSSGGCRPCIDALTEALRGYATNNANTHIVMLMREVPLRDLYVMSKEFGPQFNFYEVAALPVDFDEATTPTVFRIKDGNISDHFTCRYGDEERTTNYISTL